MNKRIIKSPIQIGIFCILLLIIGCSENNTSSDPDVGTPPTWSTNPDYLVTMPSGDDDLSGYTPEAIQYSDGTITTGYSLDQFVTKSITDELTGITDPEIDSRNLFTFNQISYDGFTPRISNNYFGDLAWDDLSQGYWLSMPEYSFRTYFPQLQEMSITGYNTKNIHKIELYRTVIVENINTVEAVFQLSGLKTYPILNYDDEIEDAIKLSDLITTFITTTPDAVNYIFVGIDDSTMVYGWRHIQGGYYLLSSETTIFPMLSAEMPNEQARFKHLLKINVFVVYDL